MQVRLVMVVAVLVTARVREVQASQQSLSSSIFYDPPEDGSPPEDIRFLFKSRGSHVQSLGSSSPLYTLVMGGRPLGPRHAEVKSNHTTASELKPLKSHGSSKDNYSSSVSLQGVHSRTPNTNNNQSSIRSFDFDLSSLHVKNRDGFISLASEDDNELHSKENGEQDNSNETQTHSFISDLPESQTSASDLGVTEDDGFNIESVTVLTLENLQEDETYATEANTFGINSDENFQTDSSDADNLSENVSTSGTVLPIIETHSQTSLRDDNTELPVIANTNDMFDNNSQGFVRDKLEDHFPVVNNKDGHLTSPSFTFLPSDQSPTEHEVSNDPYHYEAHFPDEYIPFLPSYGLKTVDNLDFDDDGDPSSISGLRNNIYYDYDALQNVYGAESEDASTDDTTQGKNVDYSDGGYEENALYFTLERDSEDDGKVTVNLGKSQERGRAKMTDNDLLEEQNYAENLYQYHVQDHETGSYKFGYGGDNQWRHEERRADGVVLGRYGWQDATGRQHTTHYVADARGFRLIRPGQQVIVHVPAATTTEAPRFSALSHRSGDPSHRPPRPSSSTNVSPVPINSLTFNKIPSPSLKPTSTTTTSTRPTTSPTPSPPLTPRPSILPPKESRPAAEEQSTSLSPFNLPENPWSAFVTPQTPRPVVAARPPPRPALLFSVTPSTPTEPSPTSVSQSSTVSAISTPDIPSAVLTPPSNLPALRPLAHRPIPVRPPTPQTSLGSTENAEEANDNRQPTTVIGRPAIAHPLPHLSVSHQPGSWVYVEPASPSGIRRPPPLFRPQYSNRPIRRPFRPVNRPQNRTKIKPLRPLRPNIGASSHYKPNRFVSSTKDENTEQNDNNETEAEYNEVDNPQSLSSPGSYPGNHSLLAPNHSPQENRPFRPNVSRNSSTERPQLSNGDLSLVNLMNLLNVLVPQAQLQPPRLASADSRPHQSVIPWISSVMRVTPKRPTVPDSERDRIQEQTSGTTAEYPLDYAFMDEDYNTHGGVRPTTVRNENQGQDTAGNQSRKNSTEVDATITSNEIKTDKTQLSGDHRGTLKWKLSVLNPHDVDIDEDSQSKSPFDFRPLDAGEELEETTLPIWTASSTTKTMTDDPVTPAGTGASEDSSTDGLWPYVSPTTSNSTVNETGTRPPPPPPPPQQGFWADLLKHMYFGTNLPNETKLPVLQ